MTRYLPGLLLSALVAGSGHSAAAQADTTKLVWYVNPMPELPSGGGSAGIMAAIYQRLIFPAECLRAQIVGRVYVAFTITPAGNVRQVTVIKALYAPFDSAAVQAVRQLPRFRPQPVQQGSVRYAVGVDFEKAAEYSVRRFRL